jgi:hypothetical protein
MKKFVWTRDIERMICETLSDKSKRLTANSDAIITLFGRVAEASEHYYSYRVTMYEVSRDWININKSSIFRALERNERLWERVGLIFTAIELDKVWKAPPDSIIVITSDLSGYHFEVIKPGDPNYKKAFLSLPGAC